MEAEIVAEGFNKSMQMHSVNKLRADGDGNMHKKILDSRPYDNITVKKDECTNHLLRNVSNKLKDIENYFKNGHITGRKLLGARIMRIRSRITMAVRRLKSFNSTQIFTYEQI